jgi:type I restriction enzyme, S subunit
MNAARLLSHYEKIADAPDAISRLRRFVLDLAVRGKLVPQDPGDEPASELLKRIAAEKTRLVKAGEIRKPKELSSVEAYELPFVLPAGWSAAPLDQLSPRSLSDGDWIETKDQSENGRVRLIQLADVGVGAFLNKSARYITEETEVRLNCTRLAVGDVLIARLPNPIGRACIFPEIGQPAITAVDVAILRPDENVSSQFLVIAMNSPSVREQIEAYGKGATRFRVSTGHLKTVQIPLPALAEQHRIVAKVDELIALCDLLEAARTEREATRDRLTAASLARFDALDPDTLRGDTRFVLDALPVLTTRADQIEQLRQAILDLAVRGKLVPQDPNDEPSSELLKRIAVEKAKAQAERNMRQDPALPDIDAAELPFAAPEGWLWGRAQDLSLKISDGVHKKPNYVTVGVPFITVKNLTEGAGISFRDTKFISEHDHLEFIKRTHPEKGDVLITKDGTIGVARIIESNRVFSIFVSVALVKMVRPEIAPFFTLCINSEAIRNTIIPKGAALKHLHLVDLRKLPLPLPPLAEQHRIVGKVAEALEPEDERELEAAE